MESAVWHHKSLNYLQSQTFNHTHVQTHSHCSDTVSTLTPSYTMCNDFSPLETPKENLHRQERGHNPQQCPSCPQRPSHSLWCETPKLSRKDACLRRRLLASKSATDMKSSFSKTPNDRNVPSQSVFDSPDTQPCGPLSYSTLKSDAMMASCRKRRLVFSQFVTSSLEERRNGANRSPWNTRAGGSLTPQDERNRESPTLSEPDLDESIISGLLPSETPEPGRGRDSFQTPVNCLAAHLSESLSILSTPSYTPIPKLDASEDSGFGSLRLDCSVDGAEDCSFQEGVQSQDWLLLSRDQRRARLERQRRLSTLREGSQSDDEVKGQRLKGKLEKEEFVETAPFMNKRHKVTLTPALQVVQALSCFTPSQDLDQLIITHLPLSHLIGRKMGLGETDILTELSMKNLHHVLSSILQLLPAKDIYTCDQVCRSWSDIVLQDRKASRRRKMYEREMRLSLEMGRAARVVDAETRLALACRSALGSVQAQAKTPSTHTHTPAAGTTCTHTPPSTKRQQFLQVAKTLFSDECLRSCPRCEHPARCNTVKAEGVCSWSDCVFHFCTSCLRAYHGSADCTRLSNTHTRSMGRSQLLPGSARSKRNIRRL
ncbi:F-box only protein 43 [Trichomycterus rosablanca]|uniref:F-box only protein 43 n=1 Tax=Trichomycterus rosablanca TaxID=2290929 RepID=UPI002F352F92